MPLDGTYEPSTQPWVRDQVELIESSGGTKGTTLRGMPVVVVTNRGVKSGKLRKTPLMRVEHEGTYAAVASQGGAPTHPNCYHNLSANPDVEVQVQGDVFRATARTANDDEKARLWSIMTDVWPNYDAYQERTDRQIPVVVLTRK